MDIEGREVKCTTCGKHKAPVGRSVSPVTYDSYCHDFFPFAEPVGCQGYQDEPKMGWLFNGERWSESFPDIPQPEPSDCYVIVQDRKENE